MAGSDQLTSLYWFNWPSFVGGADTKFVHLLSLLAREYDITVVPNGPQYLEQASWRDYLNGLGVKAALLGKLPERVEGWAVSMCNTAYFKDGQAAEMKRRGARIAWSNEMMWHFEGEVEALRSGLVDCVMYVSPAQREVLEAGYRAAVEAPPAADPKEGLWGEIPRSLASPLPWVMTGNWIDPESFAYRQRGKEDGAFTIGRLSRPDPDKFPDDFPKFYERLGLRDPVKFRVMGWSDQLSERWCEHDFDTRWELLPTAAEPVGNFLNSLDVLVYNLSPRFRESWGRAVVEAMLSGVAPIVPAGGGHHLEHLVQHGVSGFLCENAAEFGHWARALQDDRALLARLSAGARADACERHCRAGSHLRLWRRVFA